MNYSKYTTKLTVAMLFFCSALSAQRVGIETVVPDSTLSIANKVEIGGAEGDIVLRDDNASITFPVTQLPNSPMMHMFSSNVQNADRMVFAHSPLYENWGIQYRDTLDEYHFISNGAHAFSISLQTPSQGRAALGDAALHPNYTFNVETNSENRVLNIYNKTNTASITYGVYARSQGAGSGPKRGGLFSASGGTGSNIGMMATASGSTQENIAVYAYAIGTNALAALFDEGDVRVDNALYVGTDQKANGYALSVGGKIIGEELRIQDVDDWPDYVFEPDYDLMPIDELEQRIMRERHLPQVPPASEIHENGFDSGEMHKVTVRKIEELTLYLIQINKENATLRDEISALRKEVSSLRVELNTNTSK